MNAASLPVKHLFLRNDGLALHWGLAGGRGLKGPDSTYLFAILGHLEVVTRARCQTLQTSVMILAVATIRTLCGFGEIGPIGPVL